MQTSPRKPAPRSRAAERARLAESHAGRAAWKRWGPYLADRQWGTVREDYSSNGAAWDYFPHDQARSRAYRWGEDGLAGFSDDRQLLCLGLALWNERDPILKERLFGLTNGEGNHGEDVKELYYFLDATPTHSYQKMLYKYPQRAFPYAALVEANRARGRAAQELELLDTGAFDDDRYFDVFVEYAQAGPDDVLMRITVENRGPDEAPIRVLPQLWFRNTWSWTPGADRPELRQLGASALRARHAELGDYVFAADGADELLFCENETNAARLFQAAPDAGYYKDGVNDCIVLGNRQAVSAGGLGTKAAAHFTARIPPGGRGVFRARLQRCATGIASSAAADTAALFADFDEIMVARQRGADEFYAELQRDIPDADARLVQRQAFAGMLWTKQFFHYDVPQWLSGDPTQPAPPPERRGGRNHEWTHLNNADILSMPDGWEYPWYAAWDLAFHCIPLALLDAEFAKHQLVLLTREWYMHPNGQLPAYEWAFGDVNPPVHAWAAWRVFQIDRKQRRSEGEAEYAGDLAFLERVFHKLMLNFTWWVNRKDAQGRNIFQGGFLGMDNVGVFDRSAPLPTGGFINQADGTSWMAMYCLNLMRIALELALHNRVYEDIATKFFEHFLSIAEAMTHVGGSVGLWDETDEFYYDVLNLPDGRSVPLKLRSMVGLIPLFAVETLEPELLAKLPEFTARMKWYLNYRPELAALVSHWEEPGLGERRLLALLRGHRLKCVLRRMLDETAFLSDFGVRSLSREHLDQPYVFDAAGQSVCVRYEPAESSSGLFGGNSNWRGPIWFPVNYLIIESLQKFGHYHGERFTIECPTGSGVMLTLDQAASELSRRLTRLFLRGADGRRPALATHPKSAADPHFRDYPLFHEYFDGDSGRGVGASHQTGWTGLVAKLLMPRAAGEADRRPRGGAHRSSAAGTAPRRRDDPRRAQEEAVRG